MRSRFIAGSIAALAFVGTTFAFTASPVSAGGHARDAAVGNVKLNGANEVPAADPDGRGRFLFVAAGDHLCYIFTAKNIDPPLAAHIHTGAAGVNGGIVVMLMVPDPVSAECITAVADESMNSTAVLTQGELDAIIANPAGFYANVHTAPFPAGAIRGQLG
jgi:CHRD domain